MLRPQKKKNKSITVQPITEGWIVKGGRSEKTFKTKVTAVKAAKLSAKVEDSPLIVFNISGDIETVSPYLSANKGIKKVLTARGSRKLSNKKVRETIAKVMINRTTNLNSHE